MDSQAHPKSTRKAPPRAGGILNLTRFLVDWKFRKTGITSNLPLEVSVEVTNVCNFTCSFCPQSSPNHFDAVPRTYLDPDTAERILLQVREMGYDKSLIHWTLDGEPFVNKAFPQICEVARKHGFTNHYFASNMSLMTLECARSLPRGVQYTLTVDYCGDQEYFEKFRGTPRSWKKVGDNIRDILADDTLGHIRFEVKDISSYSIENPNELKELGLKLRAALPPSDRLRFFSKTFHNMTGFLDKSGSGERYQLCPYPWSSLTISANGDVVACCRDLDHKTVLGNLFEEHLKDIWNGEKYQRLREDLAAEKPDAQAACAGCDLPYDPSKFTIRNQAYALFHRLQAIRLPSGSDRR